MPDKDAVTMVTAVIGATLSIVNLIWNISSAIIKNKINVGTSYDWNSNPDYEDHIYIVNLSSIPLCVSGWSLVWEPKMFGPRKKRLDVTPDMETVDAFIISPHDIKTLYFSEGDKFDWSHNTSDGRNLILTLHIFGRRRPLRITIKSGDHGA